MTTFDVSTFLGSDVVDGTLTGDDVQNNSLTGADINEATLDLAPPPWAPLTTSVLAAAPQDILGQVKVISKSLPAGPWEGTAVVNTSGRIEFAHTGPVTALNCEMRSGSTVIGSATDDRNAAGLRSLALNGVANVPAGGGEVSVWCSGAGGCDAGICGAEHLNSGQMVLTRVYNVF